MLNGLYIGNRDSKKYFKDDKLHREDGPAVEYPRDGYEEWYINGLLHREGGPAIININGDKEWWLNGLRHREDGPAKEYADGTKLYFLNGKRHRLDGPAIVGPKGIKDVWWYHGKEINCKSQEEFEKIIKLLPFI